ncbi:glycine-rich RNA-binding protein GRP2A-like [Pollicipes pollicipes]|uniref:glycine-rich RNA-binding protein GRP2A-like n=1 Tax=Pollicipes pollicipes TaxID=41117 RepID=UPI001884E88E|nr:glycine-rich RNA-binding protein GRP2A-like [Pollicipes pollicipes]
MNFQLLILLLVAVFGVVSASRFYDGDGGGGYGYSSRGGGRSYSGRDHGSHDRRHWGMHGSGGLGGGFGGGLGGGGG